MENVRWSTKIFNADAELVHEELVGLAQTSDYYSIKPQQIVDWAREHEGSELHKCFTWDVEKAAEKCWRQEARQIVNHLVVTVNTGTKNEPTIARTMVVVENEAGSGYKPIEYILPDEYQQTLTKAWEEARAWAKRYKSLKDAGVQSIIKQILLLG